MIEQFVILDLVTKEYFYGYYSNKNWTSEISEAKYFYSLDEAKTYMENDFKNGIFQIISIYFITK